MYTYSLLDVNSSAFPSVLSPHQSRPTLHMSEKTHLITLHKKCLDSQIATRSSCLLAVLGRQKHFLFEKQLMMFGNIPSYISFSLLIQFGEF